jgi:hypothetical protein
MIDWPSLLYNYFFITSSCLFTFSLCSSLILTQHFLRGINDCTPANCSSSWFERHQGSFGVEERPFVSKRVSSVRQNNRKRQSKIEKNNVQLNQREILREGACFLLFLLVPPSKESIKGKWEKNKTTKKYTTRNSNNTENDWHRQKIDRRIEKKWVKKSKTRQL